MNKMVSHSWLSDGFGIENKTHDFHLFSEIIDTLTTTMDNTNTRLSGTTRGVDDALQTGSTKWYWFIIIILFILNIIVGVL